MSADFPGTSSDPAAIFSHTVLFQQALRLLPEPALGDIAVFFFQIAVDFLCFVFTETDFFDIRAEFQIVCRHHSQIQQLVHSFMDFLLDRNIRIIVRIMAVERRRLEHDPSLGLHAFAPGRAVLIFLHELVQDLSDIVFTVHGTLPFRSACCHC